MREKGKKPLQTHTNFTDFNFSAPDSICKVHPNLHPIGICPICLRDKLKSLICSVCGQQNSLFSCNCSDLLRNSSFSDVGSVGRISFLIENETQSPIFKNTDYNTETEKKQRPSFKFPYLSNKVEKQRNDSKEPIFYHDHEEGLKKNRFKAVLNMFLRKKKGKGFRERSREVWEGVSRSRSLCSFPESSEFAYSSTKNSDYFNSSSERASNFSETEPKKNREAVDLVNVDDDDSAFIELKICDVKRGGSCRITEREMRREKRGKKVWGWVLKHNTTNK